MLLYPNAWFQILSKKGWGTIIIIRFPLTDTDDMEEG